MTRVTRGPGVIDNTSTSVIVDLEVFLCREQLGRKAKVGYTIL